MPRAQTSLKTKKAHDAIINYINRAKAPMPVYYERYVLKLHCTDERCLIGVFGHGTTIEDLKYNADIGGTMIRKKLTKIVNKLDTIIKSTENTLAIGILKDAAKKIEALK